MTAQTLKLKSSDGRPLFVRLAQREVQNYIAQHLKLWFPLLECDPEIDLTETVLGLLTTQGHLLMRFDQYAEYVGKLWRLSREHNPLGYVIAI